jgi:hypothetical protein
MMAESENSHFYSSARLDPSLNLFLVTDSSSAKLVGGMAGANSFCARLNLIRLYSSLSLTKVTSTQSSSSSLISVPIGLNYLWNYLSNSEFLSV